MKEEAPRVIIKFEPTSNFMEEFLEFVELVINWKGKEKENLLYKKSNNNFTNKNLYDKSKM
jgi:hypothetical protein